MRHSTQRRITQAIGAALLLGLSLYAVAAPPANAGSSCEAGKVASHGGLVVDPAASSTHDLVTLTGEGTFISAILTKQGGATDITFVQLIIDGQIVHDRSVAGLRNFGLTQSNPYGVAVLNGGGQPDGIDTVTIGFPCPIPFTSSLILRAVVGASDTGVVQMIGDVIAGAD